MSATHPHHYSSLRPLLNHSTITVLHTQAVLRVSHVSQDTSNVQPPSTTLHHHHLWKHSFIQWLFRAHRQHRWHMFYPHMLMILARSSVTSLCHSHDHYIRSQCLLCTIPGRTEGHSAVDHSIPSFRRRPRRFQLHSNIHKLVTRTKLKPSNEEAAYRSIPKNKVCDIHYPRKI